MKLSKILRNKNKAFTLAEVVIVMGILGVMMAAFAPVVTKKTLAVGANSFRNFAVTEDHVGISYGTVGDSKTVLIGDTEIANSASYTPKLLITNNNTDLTSMSAQIAFATYNSTDETRDYHGQLLLDNNSNIFLGGSANANLNLTNKTNFTAVGLDACTDAETSAIDNVICIGANSGTPQDVARASARIYIGDKATQYRPGDIFFGSLSLEQVITDVAVENGWIQASDIRLKNVGEEFTGGLNEINQLEFYNYTYKRDSEKDPKVGVMAQDLQKVFPNAVKENKDGYLYIRKDDMFYAALNAIKELGKMFTTNDEKIKALEERNAMLEKQNKELQELYIELSKRIDKLDKKSTKKKLTITPTKVDEETDETTVNADVENSNN